MSKKITSTSRFNRFATEKNTDSCTRSAQASRKSIARYSSSSLTCSTPGTTTSRPSHRVASSFDAGSRQRWQTIANTARSTPERPRPPPATRLIAFPIPSSPQSASSTCGPPTSGAPRNRNPSGADARSASSAPRNRWIDPHQPRKRLPVELVLAAEAVDHPRDRHPTLVALVVRQLQVAHRLAPPRPARRRPQIHSAYIIAPPPDSRSREQPHTSVPTRFRPPGTQNRSTKPKPTPKTAESAYLMRNSGGGMIRFSGGPGFETPQVKPLRVSRPQSTAIILTSASATVAISPTTSAFSAPSGVRRTPLIAVCIDGQLLDQRVDCRETGGAAHAALRWSRSGISPRRRASS